MSFISNKKNKKTPCQVAHNNDIPMWPSTTIIVPCYNEEKTLGGTLTSLLSLNYPTDKLTITVVNDGSTDDTSNIAHRFALQHKQIMVIDKENGGKASAMNIALANTDSELIGCLDADSFVDSDALKLIARKFISDKNISAVTPAVMVNNPKNILQLMQRAEYMAGVFMRQVFSMLNSVVVTPGPFSIFRRADLLDVAIDKNTIWLHAHGTEDYEMGLRLQNAHKIIANEPLAKSLTISPETLHVLYLQRIRWVYGFLMNTWDYKHMLGNIRYGNIGILILPTALISVFGAICLFGLLIFNIVTLIFDFVIYLYTIGISFNLLKIDWFYLDISAMLFIILTLFTAVLLSLFYSAKISNTHIYKKDTAIYLLLYGLIAPLWLTGAFVRTIIGKESKWKVIR